MSAWYVFSALGFYPVNPADARYELGSPLFDSAVISVGQGKTFEVKAPGAQSQGAMYVLSAKLNGSVLDRTYIEHSEIMAGGVLELEMSTGLTPMGNSGEVAVMTDGASSDSNEGTIEEALVPDEQEKEPILEEGTTKPASDKKEKKKEENIKSEANRKLAFKLYRGNPITMEKVIS